MIREFVYSRADGTTMTCSQPLSHSTARASGVIATTGPEGLYALLGINIFSGVTEELGVIDGDFLDATEVMEVYVETYQRFDDFTIELRLIL